MEPPIKLSGHVIGVLKEYMQDLIEQAAQETLANERFGFSSPSYGPEQAIADLLALLDDRSESEGIQVGLPENFLHSMWSFCNEASRHISDRVWLEGSLDSQVHGMAKIRERTYRALIDMIESRSLGAR